MKLNNLLVLLSLALVIISCQKQPTAKFSSDKATYKAGDTIHLIDASENAHGWKWTMPDGNIVTTQNAIFVLDTLTCSGMNAFTLEVSSKNNKKNSTIHFVNINSIILKSDNFYSTTNPSVLYQPTEKKSYWENGFWVVEFGQVTGSVQYQRASRYYVYFKTIPTSNKVYSLIGSKDLLGNDNVYMEANYQVPPDGLPPPSQTIYQSGSASVYNINNNVINVVVSAHSSSSSSSSLNSNIIICK